jgi:hypothetical protein
MSSRPPFSYTFGELIDKLSIISKKDMFNLPGARQELDTQMKWLNDLGIDAYLILSIIRLTQSNADIWHLEHELRMAKEGDIPLDEVGRRAIKVREHNKTRVRYMNELDSLCGEKHITEKVQHLSADIYEKFYKRQADVKKI